MEWLRRNRFLAAAMVLPVVIGSLFLAARTIPALYVADPTYDFYFTVSRYTIEDVEPVEFTVEDNTIRARPVRDSEGDEAEKPGQMHRQTYLYRFDASTQQVEKIAIERLLAHPVILATTQTEAPDGYAYRVNRTRPSGLVTELFGMRRYRAPAIGYNGRVIRLEIPDFERHGYLDYHALGWSQ